MPSATPSATKRKTSLVGRVALASALATALGSMLASVAGGLSAVELVKNHDDMSLLDATADLAEEVEEELAEDDDGPDPDDIFIPRELPADPFGAALADELADVRLFGARAALHLDGAYVAGDLSLPRPAPGRCASARAADGPLRVCTAQRGQLSVTLAINSERADAQRNLLGLGALIGMFVGALISGLTSFGLARWALRPLSDLRDRVALVRAEDLSTTEFTEPYQHSELEVLRVAIAELIERLGAALTEAQGFAGEAAHELRTPLATLAAELELLAESSEPPDSANLARLRRQVGGLVALVQRLLVLARPGKLDPRATEPVDLQDVFDAVVDDLAPAAQQRVRVRAEDDVLIRGDSALLYALVSNALGNALKFSTDAVDARAYVDDGHCIIDVIDDGPGVPLSEQQKVFAPFYRAPSSRAGGQPGHGVGLALIAHVAAAHGGSAAFVASARGACLRITLPMWTPS